jgi:hypothetical protein
VSAYVKVLSLAKQGKQAGSIASTLNIREDLVRRALRTALDRGDLTPADLDEPDMRHLSPPPAPQRSRWDLPPSYPGQSPEARRQALGRFLLGCWGVFKTPEEAEQARLATIAVNRELAKLPPEVPSLVGAFRYPPN